MNIIEPIAFSFKTNIGWKKDDEIVNEISKQKSGFEHQTTHPQRRKYNKQISSPQ